MTGLLVVLIPLLLLYFIFGMERIEASLLRVPEVTPPALTTATDSSDSADSAA